VEVCPVDCFHEGENTLVINPDECIDCGLCEPECPVEAIFPDNEIQDTDIINLNKTLSKIWPTITKKKDPLKDAEKWKNVSGKIKYLIK